MRANGLRWGARAGGAGFLVLLLALTGCEDVLPPQARLLSVAPAEVEEGFAGELAVEGEGFTPLSFVDFEQSSRSTQRWDYRARLGEQALGQARTGEPARLTFFLPAGLPPGTHALVVEDPWGREVRLEAALVVRPRNDAIAQVATFRVSPLGPQRVGRPFSVSLEALDAEGAVVTGFSEPVALSDETGSLTPRLSGAFVDGQWTGEVEVAQPAAADVLTVTDRAGHTGTSNAFAVLAPAAHTLRFATPPRTVQAGGCSEALQVEVVDEEGGVVLSQAALPLTLAVAPAGALALFADAACSVPLDALAVPAGEARASFHVQGTVAGLAQLTVASSPLLPATQDVRVEAALPGRVAFVSASQAVVAGTCSGAVEVEVQDAFGNPAPAALPQDVLLSASPADTTALFLDAACTQATDALRVEAGGARAVGYFRATRAGTLALEASAGGLSPDTQAHTVLPAAPALLTFTSPAQVVDEDACSLPATFTALDAFGNVAPVAASTPVALAVAEAGALTLFADAACSQPAASRTLAAGQSSAAFHFQGTTPGTFTLRAGATGLTEATQPATIVTPRPVSLVFTTAPQTVEAGRCSAPLTVEARDGKGVVRPAQQDRVVALAGGEGLTFYADAGCTTPVDAQVLAQGDTTVSFFLEGTHAATLPVSATVEGWAAALQQVEVLPARVERLGFATPVREVRANQCSEPVVVATQDTFGNEAPVSASTRIFFNVAPAGGLTLYADAGCTSAVTQRQVAAGQSRTTVYFKSSSAVEATLYASASGLLEASQVARVVPLVPEQLVFTTPPRGGTVGTCLPVLSLQTRDAAGNPAPVVSTTGFTLSASPAAGTGFFTDGSCSVPVTEATFVAGSDSASFYVRGTVAGTVSVTVTGLGFTASQDVTLGVGPTARFTFSAISSPQAQGVPFAVRAQARDVFNNPTPAYVGTPLLSLSPTGPVTCQVNCTDASTTAPFVAGVWQGEVAVDLVGAGLRLSLTDSAVTGTSGAFDVVGPAAAAPPSVRLSASSFVATVGESVTFTAEVEDGQTPEAALEVSFQVDNDLSSDLPPWQSWTTGRTLTHTFTSAGYRVVRVAVRDADGHVRYDALQVHVVGAATAVCRVTGAQDVDDGATSCSEPGPDGVLSLREALRLGATGTSRFQIGFSGPMTLTATTPLVLSGAVELHGREGVVVQAPLEVTGLADVRGLRFQGQTVPTLVHPGGTFNVWDSAFLGGAGVRNQGSVQLLRVRMEDCTTDCVVDESGLNLGIHSSKLRVSAPRDAVRVASCPTGSPPSFQVKHSFLVGGAAGIRVSCARPMVVTNVTFVGQSQGVVLSGATGNRVVNALFAHVGEAVTCGGGAALADARTSFLHQSPAGCLAGTQGLRSGDARFVFPEGNDWRVLDDSPVRDAGTNTGDPFNGLLPGRFFGPQPDVGADQGG